MAKVKGASSMQIFDAYENKYDQGRKFKYIGATDGA